MSTILDMPSPQSQPPSYSETNSGPGTPMSGISTIAIKDGHAGSRPNADGVSGEDRIQRLGLGMGYFDHPQLSRANSSTSTQSMYTPSQLTPGALTPGTSTPVLGAGEKRGSPASSTVTTNSTLEATRAAKMIDGMTYDEDVVDTTDSSPIPALNKEREKNARRRLPRAAKESDQQMDGAEQTNL
jgi:hypothetical protein